jgi:hypothetical protein
MSGTSKTTPSPAADDGAMTTDPRTDPRTGSQTGSQTDARTGVDAGVDLARATSFMTTHARLVDRRRFDLLLGRGSPDATVRAVLAYRNPDGGFGSGLEADLRSPESQPGGALHAFEVFEEVGRPTAEAGELCDWLLRVSRDDGGLPFALPVTDPAGVAPFWAGARHDVSSLQITAAVAARAHGAARHDPAVAAHPWLAAATDYCLAAMLTIDDQPPPHALVMRFSLELLDRLPRDDPRAREAATMLAGRIPPSGAVHVEGGTEDEMMRALDFAPFPDSVARPAVADGVLAGELAALAAQQQSDGGWPVEFVTYSAQSALEWRGHLTHRAIAILQRNGAL